MAFRRIDPNPVQFNNDGTVCAGGELRYFENNSTTPKNVGDGPDMSPSLGNTVTLDASGRPEDDIWLDGVYRERLYDADGALQWSRDDVEQGSAAAVESIPDPSTGSEGQALFTDGAEYYLDDVRQVPDPTGSSGKYLGTDGEALTWTSFPTAEVYDEDNLPGGFTDGASSFRAGNRLWQWGTGTIPSAAAVTSNVAITFATPFTTLSHVNITITGSGGSTPQGAKPVISYVGTLTGFTAYAYAGDEHDAPGWLLSASTSFTYEAVGIVA